MQDKPSEDHLTDAEWIEFRRRHDVATAALSQAHSQWNRLDQIEAEKQRLARSRWRKAEIALLIAGALLHWLLADGKRWDFNVGTWLVIAAAWTYLIYQVNLFYLAREKDALTASNANCRLHWASALGSDDLFWRMRDLSRKRRKVDADPDDKSGAALSQEETEAWDDLYEQLGYRASGKLDGIGSARRSRFALTQSLKS